MTEGSVVVDEGQEIPTSEESQDDSQEINNDEGGEESQEIEETNTEEDGEAELTDKGTKLDPNPQSAVHQQLANAKRQVEQMEGILTNPARLKKFASQNGMTLTEAKAEIKEEQEEIVDEFAPDQFKTGADVATALNKMNTNLREAKAENKRLRDGQDGINSSRKLDKIASNMQRDITTVQDKYPELNPKSPDFDKELETSVGKLYQKLDFDQASQSFRGKVSITDIAETIMGAAKRGNKAGSRKAQTNVVVKQAGKVKSGKGKSKGNSTAGMTIAQKIAKAYGN